MGAQLPVAVIGAGPVGLAAAAHLATRGLDFVVLEAGESVASSMSDWAHVRLFSPWRFNTDPTARALLEATGWTAPDPDALPTGGDLISRLPGPARRPPGDRPAPALRRRGDRDRPSGLRQGPHRRSGRPRRSCCACPTAASCWPRR